MVTERLDLIDQWITEAGHEARGPRNDAALRTLVRVAKEQAAVQRLIVRALNGDEAAARDLADENDASN